MTTDNGIQPIPGPNPALACLLQKINDHSSEKIVVWCRFTEDVNVVMAELTANKISAVRLDGQVDQEQRRLNMESFQTDPEVRVIVGTPSTGGVGVNLAAGSTVIFYSHGFNLIERLQAMSRVRGINQKNRICQIDLVAKDTVDVRCMSLLEARVDIVGKIQDRSALLQMLKKDDADWSQKEIEVAVEESIHGHMEEKEAADLVEQMLEEKGE